MNALERAVRLSRARLYTREDLRRTASYSGHLEPATDIPDFARPDLIAAYARMWLAQVKEVSRVRH